MLIVIDFGSQTAHLIARRIRELGVSVKLLPPGKLINQIEKEKPNGIIFSGGPADVFEKGAPTIDPKVFKLHIPILGICYGFQLIAHILGGKVISGKKEYGPAKLWISNFKSQMSNGLPKSLVVWMSHGNEIIKMPEGFETVGSTESAHFALVQDPKRMIVGLLFHPEVEHTQYGSQILKNFLEICKLKINPPAGGQNSKVYIENILEKIRETAGENFVIGAVSGGVDSTVAGILTAKAIGNRFLPIFVDNGLMRQGTKEHIGKIFGKTGIEPIVVDAVGEMLALLKGIIDPERKRKIIGKFYIEIFEREMQKLLKSRKNIKFLMQGTIFSDVIESKGSRHAAKIKSHHNVGGLPAKMKLTLLEPLRELYKDEVREIGRQLGLSDEFIYKQPFPGPGYAIRIRGEVTLERLRMEKQADSIVLEELEKENILKNVFLSFPVLTGAFSTAVKGDGRNFGEVVAIRVVESKDVMTSSWSHLPYEVLQRISSRIVNEVPNISRVVYDITTKPPATMEWE